MESFKLLKRRTTDLFNSLPQNLPEVKVPNLPTVPNLSSLIPRGPFGAHKMHGTWEKIQAAPLPRSSHSVNVVAGTAYIFGGEINPRRPVDNAMHAVTLPSSGAGADYYAIQPKAAKRDPAPPHVTIHPAAEDAPVPKDLDEVPLSPSEGKGKGPAAPETHALGDLPAPRVGHATAVIGHRIFLFGGRGGPEMEALDEGGRVWVFDTRTHLWSYLDPASPVGPSSPLAPAHPAVPAPRSYHSAVATEKPNAFDTSAHGSTALSARPTSLTEGIAGIAQWARGDSDEVGIPQRPVVGHVAEKATDTDADGYGTLIIHGGCLAKGRASDVWAFDVRSRVWKRLPDAPGLPRGGTALAIGRGRLYRFGGFNGEGEEGGQLDFLELGVAVFDDVASAGEVTLVARGGWQSLIQGRENVGYKEQSSAEVPLTAGKPADEWPGHRSVAGLEAVTVGGGREYIVLMLGEREPSSGGHEAAGQFWDDVWAFQIPSESHTAASLTDTVLTTVGRKSGEGKWTRVDMRPHDDEDDASAEGPGMRGWVATSTLGELEGNAILLWGGLNGANSRLGDGWILRLGA